MKAGPAAEKEPAQKTHHLFWSIAAFVLLIVVPGFDHRWHWSSVPLWLVLAADGAVAASFVGLLRGHEAEQLRRFDRHGRAGTSRSSRRASTAIVRHPMYAGALLADRGDAARARLLLGAAASPLAALPALTVAPARRGAISWRATYPAMSITAGACAIDSFPASGERQCYVFSASAPFRLLSAPSAPCPRPWVFELEPVSASTRAAATTRRREPFVVGRHHVPGRLRRLVLRIMSS